MLAICSSALGAERADAELQRRGREIISKFVEANRYWLIAPPSGVQDLSYVLHRVSGTQEFTVQDVSKASRARVQGVTHSTLLHQLARKPRSARVTEIVEDQGKVRLALSFEPAMRGAIGNGVENSWNGYHSVGGSSGYVVLDAKRWVPLEAGVGRLAETFGEYARVDAHHYVPLTIREELGETRYDWRFRLYGPGLWLFDEGISDGRRLAWIEQVQVNSGDAKLVQATTASLEAAKQATIGQEGLRAFLEGIPDPMASGVAGRWTDARDADDKFDRPGRGRPRAVRPSLRPPDVLHGVSFAARFGRGRSAAHVWRLSRPRYVVSVR